MPPHRHSTIGPTGALRRSSQPNSHALERMSDADLVELAKTDLSSAFSEIHRRYARYVSYVLIRKGVTYGDVPDLVQELFTTACQRIGAIGQPDSLRSWLAQSARNLAVDHRRRTDRLRNDRSFDERDEGVEYSQPSDQIQVRELAEEVLRLSVRLPLRQRRAVELLLTSEADTAQRLAAEFRTSKQASRSEISRARARLRELLEIRWNSDE